MNDAATKNSSVVRTGVILLCVLAMAQALREGKLGVMDYYNLRNVAADTEMRDAIGKATSGSDDDDQA